jgi:DNA-binding NarL/FixJ family response regulator
MRGNDVKTLQLASDGTSRVLVLADQSGIVYALRRMLRQTTGFTLVGYTSGRAPVGPVVEQSRPDVVIVDDLGSPTAAVARIGEARSAAPSAKIVLLVPDPTEGWIEDAVRAGAHAVLSKSIEPVSAATLLREIVRGTVFHCLADTTLRAGVHRDTSEATARELGLTPREHELLELVASGATNSRLARQLFVTEQTVKFHLSNIYRKLGVANRTQASRYAYTHGLVRPATAIQPDELDRVVMRAA